MELQVVSISSSGTIVTTWSMGQRRLRDGFHFKADFDALGKWPVPDLRVKSSGDRGVAHSACAGSTSRY